jgi:hypothetical protein
VASKRILAEDSATFESRSFFKVWAKLNLNVMNHDWDVELLADLAKMVGFFGACWSGVMIDVCHVNHESMFQGKKK